MIPRINLVKLTALFGNSAQELPPREEIVQVARGIMLPLLDPELAPGSGFTIRGIDEDEPEDRQNARENAFFAASLTMREIALRPVYIQPTG